MYYEKVDIDSYINYAALNQQIDPSILCRDLSISWYVRCLVRRNIA